MVHVGYPPYLSSRHDAAGRLGRENLWEQLHSESGKLGFVRSSPGWHDIFSRESQVKPLFATGILANLLLSTMGL